MKNFHIFCYLSIIILSYVVSMVESLFPVDLVRVVLGMPSTPAINTPSLAWFVLIVGYTVIGISIYIGLPRVPPPKPLRRRSTFEATSTSTLQHNFGLDYGAVVDMMAEMDISDCFARYLCQVGTQRPEETTFVQKLLSDLVRMAGSESAPLNHTVFSQRNTLLDAIKFGQTSQCSTCCHTLYKACNLTNSELILF